MTKQTSQTRENYYQIQYRLRNDPFNWHNYTSADKGIYKSFAEAKRIVYQINEQAKGSGLNPLLPICLEYRIVEREVSTVSEVLWNFPVSE